MEKERKVEQESLEEHVEEVRKEMYKLFDLFLPPKEVRKEIIKNLYTIELSFWKILKTLVDYEVERLEQKMEGGKSKERVKRVEVE